MQDPSPPLLRLGDKRESLRIILTKAVPNLGVHSWDQVGDLYQPRAIYAQARIAASPLSVSKKGCLGCPSQTPDEAQAGGRTASPENSWRGGEHFPGKEKAWAEKPDAFYPLDSCKK